MKKEPAAERFKPCIRYLESCMTCSVEGVLR